MVIINVPKGTTKVLPVLNTAGFKPGQTVVIDEKGDKEIRRIDTVPKNSKQLILNKPLAYSHKSGTVIQVSPGELAFVSSFSLSKPDRSLAYSCKNSASGS